MSPGFYIKTYPCLCCESVMNQSTWQSRVSHVQQLQPHHPRGPGNRLRRALRTLSGIPGLAFRRRWFSARCGVLCFLSLCSSLPRTRTRPRSPRSSWRPNVLSVPKSGARRPGFHYHDSSDLCAACLAPLFRRHTHQGPCKRERMSFSVYWFSSCDKLALMFSR